MKLKATTTSAASNKGRSSTVVIYAGLIGDLLVTFAKLAAALISGSSAMLTEAIHSFTDALNEVLLLVGQRRGAAPPDARHPFGYGLETYFWAFVVAIVVLLFGGIASLYEGYTSLRNSTPVTSPLLSLGVLLLSAIFEGGSFLVAYRAYKQVSRWHSVGKPEVGLWQFIKLSKDPALYAVLLSNGAALVGLLVAAVGIAMSAYLGFLGADGVASLAIGALLIGQAAVVLEATRGLIGGEAVAPPLQEAIARTLEGETSFCAPAGIATLQLGPEIIMVVLTLDLSPALSLGEATTLIRTVTTKLKELDYRITYVLTNFE